MSCPRCDHIGGWWSIFAPPCRCTVRPDPVFTYTSQTTPYLIPNTELKVVPGCKHWRKDVVLLTNGDPPACPWCAFDRAMAQDEDYDPTVEGLYEGDLL